MLRRARPSWEARPRAAIIGSQQAAKKDLRDRLLSLKALLEQADR
jgi:hypothetical protein